MKEDYYYLGKSENGINKIPLRSRSIKFYDMAFGNHLSEESIAGKKIIDTGSGFSTGVKCLSERGGIVTGVDPEYDSLNAVAKTTLSKLKLDNLKKDYYHKKSRLERYMRLLPTSNKNILLRTLQNVNPLYHNAMQARGRLREFFHEEHLSLLDFLKDHKEHPERYKTGKVQEIPYIENDSVDICISAFLYPFHFEDDPDTFVKGLEEILRVIKPNGKILMFPFNKDYFRKWMISKLEEHNLKFRLEDSEFQQLEQKYKRGVIYADSDETKST